MDSVQWDPWKKGEFIDTSFPRRFYRVDKSANSFWCVLHSLKRCCEIWSRVKLCIHQQWHFLALLHMRHGILEENKVQSRLDFVVTVKRFQQGFVQAPPGLHRHVFGLANARGEVAVYIHHPYPDGNKNSLKTPWNIKRWITNVHLCCFGKEMTATLRIHNNRQFISFSKTNINCVCVLCCCAGLSVSCRGAYVRWLDGKRYFSPSLAHEPQEEGGRGGKQ